MTDHDRRDLDRRHALVRLQTAADHARRRLAQLEAERRRARQDAARAAKA